MTDDDLIAALRMWSKSELCREAADRIEALVRERDALKVSYEDIYYDAMADAESDAREFETDLWKLVRQYITELDFDWSGDASLEGVTADEALQHIRECMDGETARAERLEAAVAILEDALQEAGDDYPGSSMQQWCQQQVKAARTVLKGDNHE